jgi:hypothetical protein
MSRLPTVIVALMLVASVAGRVGARTDQGAWATMKADGGVTIYYVPAFAADAEKAKAYLHQTVESLAKEFDGQDVKKILESIECRFYLHPKPNDKASERMSLCTTNYLAGGKVYAELHFLTPTVLPAGSLNSVGEPRAADHTLFRYIVHEYGSIWLGLLVRDKPKGWRTNGNDAPNWFWQGYEEYLGMTRSSEHSRTVTFAKYMEVVKADPDSVMLARGYKDKTPRLVAGHDYTDGFAILAYMHERFGKEAVQRILRSEAETFGEAMRAATQIDEAAFYESYQQWVEKWQPAHGESKRG